MREWKVPAQSLIDHIRTAVDVDPWAKEMAEELLTEQEAVKPKIDAFGHPYCPKCKILVYETWKFCPHCGQEVKWSE